MAVKPIAHKSMHKQFNEWITQVYGGRGLTAEQREGLYKAFFCGAFVMLNINRELGELEDKENAVAQLDVFTEELLLQISKWVEAEGEQRGH